MLLLYVLVLIAFFLAGASALAVTSLALVMCLVTHTMREEFSGTSPGTHVQLATSSAYYPFWMYDRTYHRFRWPASPRPWWWTDPGYVVRPRGWFSWW